MGCSSTCCCSSRLRLSSCSSCSCSSSTCCCCSSRSGCSSSSSSDGCSCGRSIGVSSFQGFHSFVLMYFINKQTNKHELFASCKGSKQCYLFSSSIYRLLFCAFPLVLSLNRTKNQEFSCNLCSSEFCSFKFYVLLHLQVFHPCFISSRFQQSKNRDH